MTTVRFFRTKPTQDGESLPVGGTLRFTPTRKRVVEHVEGPAETILPIGFTAQVPSDTGRLDVDLAPTEPGWVWEIYSYGFGVTSTFEYVIVPDQTDPIDEDKLVRVSKDTLDPEREPDPAWWAELESAKALGSQVQQAKTHAVVAASDAGAARDQAQSAQAAAQQAAETIGGSVSGAQQAAQDAAQAKAGAVTAANTATQAATEAAQAADTATSVAGIAGNLSDRLTGVEAVAGLTAEAPIDGQTANLIQQPSTLTSAALSAAIVDTATPQADYVSLLAGMSPYTQMSVTKLNSGGELAVKCFSDSGAFTEYRITPNTRYQYVGIVHAMEVGEPTNGPSATYSSNDLTLAGNYYATTTTPYTATVGDTWTRQITTTSSAEIFMGTFVDNRGGMWRVTVNGRSETADVSTWAATATTRTVSLFTLPAAGTYTIRGEFIGSDPINPPATGGPRGWLQTVTSSNPGVFALRVVETVTSSTITLSPSSNKDFALRFKKAGVAGSTEYVPYHGTASEAFASPTTYFVDGAPLDVTAMAAGDTVIGASFEWVQHIYGRNSGTGAENLIEVWTTQRITRDGTYSVAGRWKTLTDIEAGTFLYHGMLMGYRPLFTEAVSTRRESVRLAGVASPVNLPTTSGARADGWVLLSDTSDQVAAVQHKNRSETLRVGQADTRAVESQTFIELRSGGDLAKIYPTIYDTGKVIPAGRNHRFTAAWWYGRIPGIRDALTLR